MKAIKVSVIVQATHEKEIRDALTRAGAGVIGSYKGCQFVTRGEAQFEPTEESSPALGDKEKMNIVDAVQIQTWCLEGQVEEIVAAVKAAHPNEEPGIELIPFEMR